MYWQFCETIITSEIPRFTDAIGYNIVSARATIVDEKKKMGDMRSTRLRGKDDKCCITPKYWGIFFTQFHCS